jgi:hypothetical protein
VAVQVLEGRLMVGLANERENDDVAGDVALVPVERERG